MDFGAFRQPHLLLLRYQAVQQSGQASDLWAEATEALTDMIKLRAEASPNTNMTSVLHTLIQAGAPAPAVSGSPLTLTSPSDRSAERVQTRQAMQVAQLAQAVHSSNDHAIVDHTMAAQEGAMDGADEDAHPGKWSHHIALGL